MIKRLLALTLMFACGLGITAQRVTDKLDRGLVAVDRRDGGILLSWRVQDDEYYGVTYNVYKNGTKLNAKPLEVSNYLDADGTFSATYTVRAVVNGVEQAASAPALKLQDKYEQRGYAGAPGHLDIPMKDVVDRNGRVVYSATVNDWYYSINDVSLADLDGDGQIELIVKRINETDTGGKWPNGADKPIFDAANKTAYSIIEAYKLDGRRLWWIDCGPNMCSMNCVEINAVAYDWDEDGKAEVVMRGADNMIIHMADGKTYNIGNMSVNTRNELVSHTTSNFAWTHTGAEYLIYMNGETGSPYQVIEYPLKRYENNEVGKQEWEVWNPIGKSAYGHRSSKYFFGAPVLDGRHASIFLGRGIYTQIKMCALDVNRSTHQLTQRWYWKETNTNSKWFGQGNHNFSIADVDGDGCDEIIYGSMTIDHNGKGLSTSGLGHGDAIHVGDLDPFTPGLEVFACNEDDPANNFRSATTSQLYHRDKGTGDDGRALMGNFSNSYPGCIGRSVSSGVISSASHSVISGMGADDLTQWANLNGRIYWDGDLCEEIMASPNGARNTHGVVYKTGNWRIMQTDGVSTINDTKKNHCAQGDIFGDWREEIIMRTWDDKKLRIYSTDVPTEYRLPSLWYDPEYRQAMVWQCCGYNQPPHVGFFVGEMEGLTKAPVPLSNKNRVEISSGRAITAEQNGKDVLLCATQNRTTVSEEWGIAAGGASPRTLIVNVPSDITGSGNNAIDYNYSIAALGAGDNKGDLTGNMNFVKQGDGILKITNRTFTYTGTTEIWGGDVQFNGTWANSNVWMNRHTRMFLGGTVAKELTMEYGSSMGPSNNYHTRHENSDRWYPADFATANVGTLNLHEGSRVVIQIGSLDDTMRDFLNIDSINIRTQDWQYGPKYSAPVFDFRCGVSLPDGQYKVGTLRKVGEGSLGDIIIENIRKVNSNSPVSLKLISGNLYLVVGTVTSFKLDFEEAGTNYGFTGNATMSQQSWGATAHYASSGSHYFHIDQKGGAGDRTAYINLKAINSDFVNNIGYKLAFDWGNSCSNQNPTTFNVKGDDGAVLFYMQTPKFGATTVYDASGTVIATVENDGYSNACPLKLSHYVIEGTPAGTYLTISYQNTTVLGRYKLSDVLKHVTAFDLVLGRAVSHAAFDDIVLYDVEKAPVRYPTGYEWTGVRSNDWFSLQNWRLNGEVPSQLPGRADDVFIGATYQNVETGDEIRVRNFPVIDNGLELVEVNNILVTKDASLTVGDHQSAMLKANVIAKQIIPQSTPAPVTTWATLSHTANANYGSRGEPNGVDDEMHWCNNDALTGWSAFMFIEFGFNIPEGAEVQSATLSVKGLEYNAFSYSMKIYALNKGVSINYANDGSSTSIYNKDANPNHQHKGERFEVLTVNNLQGGGKPFELTGLDVTNAVKTMKGNGKIIFQLTGNAGSAQIYGKGAAENMRPTLQINYQPATPEPLQSGAGWLQIGENSGAASQLDLANGIVTYTGDLLNEYVIDYSDKVSDVQVTRQFDTERAYYIGKLVSGPTSGMTNYDYFDAFKQSADGGYNEYDFCTMPTDNGSWVFAGALRLDGYSSDDVVDEPDVLVKSITQKGSIYDDDRYAYRADDERWLLMSNPYLMATTTDKVLENNANFKQTMYFRQYREGGYSWLVRNKETGVNINADNNDDVVIAPGQAFFVKLDEGQSNVDFAISKPEGIWTESHVSLKREELKADVLRLFANTWQYGDRANEIALVLREDGSLDRSVYDSPMYTATGVQLYQLKGSKKLVISVLPTLSDIEDEAITLGVQMAKGISEGVIYAGNAGEIAEHVYLHDLKEDCITDLAQPGAVYSFSQAAGTADNNRFVLVLKGKLPEVDLDDQGTVTDIAVGNKDVISIVAQDGKAMVSISQGLVGEARATVYDVQGRQMSSMLLTEQCTQVDVPHSRAIYIVRVEGNGMSRQVKVRF